MQCGMEDLQDQIDLMLYLNKTADEAYEPFQHIMPEFPSFHDASPCPCTFDLTVYDVLCGVQKARQFDFFDFTFAEGF